MSLRSAIFAKLKTGSIADVYNFEDSERTPGRPYVVLKEDTESTDFTSRGETIFRVFCHMDKGMVDDIDSYLLSLTALFSGRIQDTAGTQYEVTPGDLGNWTTENDDNTISRERIITSPVWT
jgi:hypothetical protein